MNWKLSVKRAKRYCNVLNDHGFKMTWYDVWELRMSSHECITSSYNLKTWKSNKNS